MGSSTGGYWRKKKVIALRNGYHGCTFVAASMKEEFTDYGWKRWMEGEPNEVKNHPAHSMFMHVDPPYDLFINPKLRREGENAAQASGQWR